VDQQQLGQKMVQHIYLMVQLHVVMEDYVLKDDQETLKDDIHLMLQIVMDRYHHQFIFNGEEDVSNLQEFLILIAFFVYYLADQHAGHHGGHHGKE
jgi:hypothetical protein